MIDIEQMELKRCVSKYGISHTTKRYKCTPDEVLSRLAKSKINTVVVPNVKVGKNEFIYYYKRKNVTVISKNLGDTYDTIIENLAHNEINYECKPDEYIAVTKKEMKRLLTKYSFEKLAKKLNVYPHKLVLFLNLKVKD